MGKTVYGRLCTGGNRWCNHGPWYGLEHCRDIQRSDGDPEPDRVVPVVGYGCEAGKGLFCKTT